jgi:membrane protein required for colicin V production
MFTAFDVGFAILVLISAILATARGLTREILSLVTWVGSAAIAAYMYFKHPDIARGYIQEQIVADVATVAVSFIVALIVLHLITMKIADFVVDSRIGALDRTLGFIFGALRGILIAVVLVGFGLWLFTNKTPGEADQSDLSKLPSWASESKTILPLNNAAGELIAALPKDLEEQLTNLMHKAKPGVAAGDENAAPDANGADTGGDDTTSPDDANASPDAAPAGGDDVGTDSTAPSNSAPAQAPAPAQTPAAPANSGV